jgi:hypothetical protein
MLKSTNHFFSFLILILIVISCKNDISSEDTKAVNPVIKDTNVIQDPIIEDTFNEKPIKLQSGKDQISQPVEVNQLTKKKTVKIPKASSEEIMKSPEFINYMQTVFTLSNENTTEDLNYVNSFMAKHDLSKEMRKDQCNLLNNEKVQSDSRVFDFWKVRCNFNKAQKKVVDRFNISYDDLGNLMKKRLNESQNDPTLPMPGK